MDEPIPFKHVPEKDWPPEYAAYMAEHERRFAPITIKIEITRDILAAMAMQGLCSRMPSDTVPDAMKIIESAHFIAQAMIDRMGRK